MRLALVCLCLLVPLAAQAAPKVSDSFPIIPTVPVQGGGGDDAGPQPPETVPPRSTMGGPPGEFWSRPDMPVSDQDLAAMFKIKPVPQGPDIFR